MTDQERLEKKALLAKLEVVMALLEQGVEAESWAHTKSCLVGVTAVIGAEWEGLNAQLQEESTGNLTWKECTTSGNEGPGGWFIIRHGHDVAFHYIHAGDQWPGTPDYIAGPVKVPPKPA